MFDPSTLPYNDPTQTRKVAVVTGANTGIGYFTTKHLLLHGYDVYLACRNETSALEAIESLKIDIRDSKTATGSPEFIHLNLSSLKQTEETAEILKRKEPKGIDVLVNNAGVMAIPVSITEDGYDIQYQVNHIAPALLTLKLLPLLQLKKSPRVINVSSIGQALYFGSSFTNTFDYFPTMIWGFFRYGAAKSFSIQFMNSLALRFPTQILFSSVHPGVCSETNLASYWTDIPMIGWLFRGIFNSTRFLGGISPEEGCYTSINCALADLDTKEFNGKFWRPWPHVAEPTRIASDTQECEKTWKWTVEELVKKGFLDEVEVEYMNHVSK